MSKGMETGERKSETGDRKKERWEGNRVGR